MGFMCHVEQCFASLAPCAPLQVVLEESGGPHLGVTSPAAAMALCLMFLASNDGRVAAALSVPGTHAGLYALRPDLVMLRVLGRAMVMWEGVQPSQAWLDAQLPPLLQVRDVLSLHRPETVLVPGCQFKLHSM